MQPALIASHHHHHYHHITATQTNNHPPKLAFIADNGFTASLHSWLSEEVQPLSPPAFHKQAVYTSKPLQPLAHGQSPPVGKLHVLQSLPAGPPLACLQLCVPLVTPALASPAAFVSASPAATASATAIGNLLPLVIFHQPLLEIFLVACTANQTNWVPSNYALTTR